VTIEGNIRNKGEERKRTGKKSREGQRDENVEGA
jgi:hypothetical protein